MSILEDFARGFLTSYKGDMDKKEADQRAAQERKRAYAERVAEENRRRKLDQMDRRQAREEELADRREGAGYNPETGNMEWVDGTGKPGSRPATMAEQAAYQSSLSEAKRQRDKDALEAERIRSQISKDNRWTPSSYNSDEDSPRPISPQQAAAIIGVTDPAQLTSGSVEERVFRDLVSGKIFPQEAEEMKRVYSRKRVEQQAAQDAITARLPVKNPHGR